MTIVLKVKGIVGSIVAILFLISIGWLYIDYKVEEANHLLLEMNERLEILSAKYELVKDGPDYYPWISSISFGPRKWHEQPVISGEDEEVGLFYRVAITTSEIYSGVNVELISQGEEGCCMKLKSIQKLDLDKLAEKHSLVRGITGFKVIGWEDFNKFTFTVQNRKFLALIVNSKTIEVQEVFIERDAL